MSSMLETQQQPLTFLRFGLQRKKAFLRDVRNAYDGLVLPANILLYQYKSTPSVVLMCEKPFFVDPMSYLFGQPYEQFKRRVKSGPQFKPSFDRLMLGHGLKPGEFLGYSYERLLAFLKSSPENCEILTTNALSFQWNRVWDTISNARELLTAEQQASLVAEAYRPSFLIPPYFRYGIKPQDGNVATDLNRAINEYCHSARGNWQDIFPMVFVEKETLRNRCVEDVIRLATEHDFPGHCVWADKFDERDATEAEISGLIHLVRSLAENNKR
jgi:hypothetical protein